MCSLNWTYFGPTNRHGRPAHTGTLIWRLQCQWNGVVGCSLLPHVCALNIALLDRRLWNRWQGITLSPTLNTDILGQAFATHSAICLFVLPLKSPHYPHIDITRLGDIHEWNRLDSWASLAKHTLPLCNESNCLKLFKEPRQVCWVGYILGFGPMSQSPCEGGQGSPYSLSGLKQLDN